MHAMLHTDAGHGLLEIVIRTTAVYFCLLLGLRLSGKREIGQITPFDLAVLLLISNAVQNAMTGGDNSLTGGLLSAAVLLALNSLVAGIRMRSPRLQRFVEGVPTVLISRGKVQEAALAHERMTTDELNAALRQHEVADLGQVEMAVLEIDGSISVVRRDPDGAAPVVHTRKKLVHHHKSNDG